MNDIYIVFDTETTGLEKPEPVELYKHPFMIEIYCQKIRFDKDNDIIILGEFESLVKPPVPVSDKITEITSITNDMLRKAPTFIEIYDELCRFFLGTTYMVAHNCSFDMGIIRDELKRHDKEYHFPWPKEHICTVERTECITNKRLNLKTLYQIATGKDSFPNAHRAKGDVIPLVEILPWLKENNFL